MWDALDAARTLVPGLRLEHVEMLGGSNRSEVRRVSTGSGTLIVKAFTGSGEGWVRETAALSVLPEGAPAPRLVAAGDAPPIVVMSDIGPGPSVADALLGNDPALATDAVVSWAKAVATLHRVTAGGRGAFRAALADRAGDWPVDESTVATDLEEAARNVASSVVGSDAGSVAGSWAELGVDVPAEALTELRGLATRLSGDGPAALTPGDTCPDNNVRRADGLALIDFESAQWRHLAWDVAYLVVPWPSCWCAWRIPAEVSQRAVVAYQDEIALPYVHTRQFHRDLTAAAVGWTFVSTSWFLARARADDPPLGDPAKPTPTRRAMILHRLDGARQQAELPALATLAGRMHDALTGEWGHVPLGYAPAFRD